MSYTWEKIQDNRKSLVDRMRDLDAEGVYPAIGVLASDEGDCASGIACHLFVQDTGRGECRMIDRDEVPESDWQFYGFEIDGEIYTSNAPRQVADWLGVDYTFIAALTAENDYGYKTFDDLADWTESEYEKHSIVTDVQKHTRPVEYRVGE